METMGCVGLKETATAAEEGAGREEEVELELGLSIGRRSYASKRSEKVFELHQICKAENDDPTTSLTASPSPEVVLEPIMTMTKREMHAWRRREAKKKREEKLMVKKGLCSSSSLPRNGDYDYCGSTLWANGENGFHNEGREEKEEEEEEEEELKCKKCKTAGEDAGSGDLKNNYVNLNLSIDQQENMYRPQIELQYGYPGNGFVFPRGNVNVMPCWFAGGSPAPVAPPVGLEGNNVIQQPVVSYGFRLFQLGSEAGSNGLDSEKTKKKNVRGRTEAGSNGSSACTSSAGSDHMRSSREGAGSSETRSHSTHSEPKPKKSERNASKSTDAKSESEHSATSHLMESSAVNELANHVDKAVPSTSVQCSTTEPKPKEEACKSRTEPLLADKHMSTPNTPMSGSSKQSTGKPPKPKTQNQDTPASLPYMPCVSTTGNGPNGKTINGVLYRYTKTEVSIICVCHGTSFSPAEFVQHAGGTDVSHPLRHITVIPSAF